MFIKQSEFSMETADLGDPGGGVQRRAGPLYRGGDSASPPGLTPVMTALQTLLVMDLLL